MRIVLDTQAEPHRHLKHVEVNSCKKADSQGWGTAQGDHLSNVPVAVDLNSSISKKEKNEIRPTIVLAKWGEIPFSFFLLPLVRFFLSFSLHPHVPG